MGIALSGLNQLTAPLRSLLGWLARAAGAQRATGPSSRVEQRAARPADSAPRATSSLHSTAMRGRPLRVVRVVDAARPAAGAGRMFISGRMADVCAELDRLAAMEAAAG